MTMKKSASPWKRKRPEGPKTPLTAASKAAAKKRAAKAGRKYPNLVDNMYAAARQKASKPKKSDDEP